ncbi:MAG: hypothetical protein ACTSU2_15700 [Promethearchaeota archaeon]
MSDIDNIDGTDFKHVKLRVKFKTYLNLVWGTPIGPKKKEAIAYARGFPGTFYMTDRRAFVTGIFVEKMGWRKKSVNNYVYFEAGLQYIDKYELDILKKIRSGYISFKPHGMLKKGIIHFIRLDPDISLAIKEVIANIPNLKRLRKDTGIVKLGENPISILKKRLGA